MKIELESNLHGKNRISSYSEGCVYINEKCIDTSCIITADIILQDWLSDRIEPVRCKDIDPVIDLDPEIILLGSSKDFVIPAIEISAYVQAKQIGFECMDTGAAIRSYNILLSEDRKVALALILS